ncbi:D-2-hydroxyacid dehydrogenase family protein [Roseovarius atlanticus]|uniref:D-2-hydroxyacid dehydrogenase family protein n=1 Tax=Roseovarius atlanticus TaxID=1641875 RepID=UPI001C984C98|nr:D-2-hydroxyacid dehydrogenase family protein [Roseovarius atlanticus]MBY5988296.1 D-2-hydroxyacid dehydrogenase family protein [Roseovarius atlanticus]MBY6123687.1 D-2-hydroxyacid dehydrogenase family protein [Roseovarius atlanticus]MBY6148182.1 D-2-hydroxyacid dehydrogenase family protein [Roseovarius atlanticus]
MRVAFLDDFHNAYEKTDGVAQLRQHADVCIFTEEIGVPSELGGFDAIVATRERTVFDREMLESLPDLKLLCQTGNHAYHIDMLAAEQLGIKVGKASGGFCGAAGELAIALMMSSMRRIPHCDAALKAGEWPTPMTPVLRGKTLGIVGLGNIGKFVAGICKAFGMEVVAWGGRLSDTAAAEVGVRRVDLDELVAISDVISVHATLSPATRSLIDARHFALMKPTAHIINTARGPIINEAAMIDALREKKIAGAGLDVFDTEPLPTDHPLRKLDNVVLTPHLGWPTDEMYAQFADASLEILLAYKSGAEFPEFSSTHS